MVPLGNASSEQYYFVPSSKKREPVERNRVYHELPRMSCLFVIVNLNAAKRTHNPDGLSDELYGCSGRQYRRSREDESKKDVQKMTLADMVSRGLV
jgi:hypothetical protein